MRSVRLRPRQAPLALRLLQALLRTLAGTSPLRGWALVTLALALTLAFGATAASAAHGVLEAPQSQVADVLDAGGTSAPADGDQNGGFYGVCSGHCAAHAFSLPVPVSEPTARPAEQAVWPSLTAQGSEASRPFGIKRPPRV